MATTPRGIVYPTNGSQLVPLEGVFAALAQSADDAMDNFVLPGSYTGTEAQRNALAAPDLREGIYWRATDSDLTWYYTGSVWEPFDVIVGLGVDSTTSPNQTGITTTAVTVTGLQVSVTLTRVSDLRARAQLSTYSTHQGDVVAMELWDGSTKVAEWFRPANSSPTSGMTGMSHALEVPLQNVSAGTHVYTFKVSRIAGSGTITIAPSATTKNWLAIDRVG